MGEKGDEESRWMGWGGIRGLENSINIPTNKRDSISFNPLFFRLNTKMYIKYPHPQFPPIKQITRIQSELKKNIKTE